MINNTKNKLSFTTLCSLLEGTIDNIQKAVTIRGANIWMLFSVAVLAGIGLDTNYYWSNVSIAFDVTYFGDWIRC